MSPIDHCGNCSSRHIVHDGSGEASCVACGAPLCEHCNQVLESYGQEGGAVSRRHERTDLVAPRCPAHRAELVEQRRARMYLIQGGAA